MRPLSDVLVTSSLPATQPIVPQHQLDKCHGNNALSHSRTLTQTFSGEETLTFLVISYFGRRHSSSFFNTLQIYFPFHDNPLSAGLFPCVKHKWLFSYSFIFWYFHALFFMCFQRLDILPTWTSGKVVFIGNYINPKSASRPTPGWQFNFQSNLKHTHHDLTMTMNIGSCTGETAAN